MSEDPELAKLREKRMKELLAKAEQAKHATEHPSTTQPDPKEQQEQAVLQVMQGVLTPDAFQYLLKIKSSKPNTYTQITQEIITAIRYGAIRTVVPLLVIKRLERDIEGVEPTIRIKRRGEDEKRLQ